MSIELIIKSDAGYKDASQITVNSRGHHSYKLIEGFRYLPTKHGQREFVVLKWLANSKLQMEEYFRQLQIFYERLRTGNFAPNYNKTLGAVVFPGSSIKSLGQMEAFLASLSNPQEFPQEFAILDFLTLYGDFGLHPLVLAQGYFPEVYKRFDFDPTMILGLNVLPKLMNWTPKNGVVFAKNDQDVSVPFFDLYQSTAQRPQERNELLPALRQIYKGLKA